MNEQTAHGTGLGYAWGREDASGIRTLNGVSQSTPSFEFAVVFAQGWTDYINGLRGHMITVREAYENWQASGGTRIFKQEDSTAECQERYSEAKESAVKLTEAQKRAYAKHIALLTLAFVLIGIVVFVLVITTVHPPVTPSVLVP